VPGIGKSVKLIRPPKMLFFDVLRAKAQVGRTVKRISLTGWIFIGMAAGIAVGFASPAAALKLQILPTIFLRLIKSIVAPLLFGTLGLWHRRHRRRESHGRIGLKAIVFSKC